MNRLPSIRRWGVAALTGVTLFGGLSLVGAGGASAATAPTVTAALTTGATVTPISGNTGTAGASVADVTLTVNGNIALNDQITLTLACPTSGTASFLNPTGITVAGSGTWTAGAPVLNSSGCSTETLTAGAAVTASSTSLSITGMKIVTSGVPSQNLAITGTYGTIGLAATTFTLPTIVTVSYYTVTSNTPAVTLPASGTTAVSPITVSAPSNLAATDLLSGTTASTTTAGAATKVTNAPAIALTAGYATANMGQAEAANSGVVVTPVATFPLTSVTVTGLPTGMTSAGFTGSATTATTVAFTGTPTASGTYTVTVTAKSNALVNTSQWTIVVSPVTVTLTLTAPSAWSGTPSVSQVGMAASASATGQVLTVTVTAEPAVGFSGSFGINGMSVTTNGATPGAVDATVGFTNPAGAATTMATASVGTVLGNVTTIYGANGTADGTVAAEFENAYPASASNSASGNRNVVLATDIPATNGSDALAASYLEGSLGTGLLITPPTTLGADAKSALQLEGVTTVYVVGGPLAISPAVIAQIKALPAYNPGGLTTTGSTINVVGPIYGATAADTAAAIATHFGSVYGSGQFPGAYTTDGIGKFNTTTGVGTTTAPTGAVPTAIVVASSDWQDAVSVAPEAFAMRFPVILNGPSSDTTLSSTAQATLTSLGVKQVIIVGGQLALQNSVEAQIAALNGGISVLRIAGIDSTDTAAQIANFAWGTQGVDGLGWSGAGKGSVIVSHGDYWSDALGAAALGGGANQTTFGYEPILLTQNPTTIGQYTTTELTKVPSDVHNLTVLGGPLAMPSSTVQTLLAGL